MAATSLLSCFVPFPPEPTALNASEFRVLNRWFRAKIYARFTRRSHALARLPLMQASGGGDRTLAS
jgi:hypothetical protein